MKYTTRPAPAPPMAVSQQMAKPKPPRPPPPKAVTPALQTQQNDSKSAGRLFSNLFGASKKNSNKSSDKLSQMEVKLPPPKLPKPPVNAISSSSSFSSTSSHVRHQNYTPVQQLTSDVQLINFEESPPTSPSPVGFIKKSNTGGSDSVSMDSFCSTNSSPNNNFNSGTTSQAESGFEDDFSVSDFKVSSRATSRSTTFTNDPFDCLDDFSSSASTPSSQMPVKNNIHSNIRNMKPLIQPKPTAATTIAVNSIGNTNFYAPTVNNTATTLNTNFDDSLSNGKNLIKPSVVSMPTIIKPPSATNINRKPSPLLVPSTIQSNNNIKKSTSPAYKQFESTSDDSFEDDLPSPPMPTFQPPVLKLDNSDEYVNDESDEKESFGIALFDFASDVTEDLNFKANEKIYLIQQMNDEWMYGRNKRGCEGIFPISYIDVKVPLKNSSNNDSGTASRSESVSPAATANYVRVLYTFIAETDGDLSINENELVNVMYDINGEWLYGTNVHGQSGQFPSNYLEYIPQNLQPMPN